MSDPLSKEGRDELRAAAEAIVSGHSGEWSPGAVYGVPFDSWRVFEASGHEEAPCPIVAVACPHDAR